ncbi:protein NUCLEAR FUSION DEFECTIVE 4-like [Silene latifolia]|uniref:protein NUCLEAR FUSION DEFECTIVE 4-like n=1 Tax=Silene latifolia TaxID=37657 RepID=UPI003D76F35D
MDQYAMDSSINIISSESRWVATVASIWIQAMTGWSYTFSIYSAAIKSSQSYDQSTLDTISVFKDLGANFGVLSGLLYSAVSSVRNQRGGCCGSPWVVLVLGSAQCFLGYFLLWLSVVGVIDKPRVGFMCVFMLVAAHSQTFFNTANVVTAVQNFPEYSGTIVGIMKGFSGLSGAMLIQVHQAFFKGNPTTFILMLALLPSTLTLSLMCLVRISPQSRANDEKKYLNGFSIIALFLAAYMMIIIIFENIFNFPTWGRFFALVGMLMLLSLPLKIAVEAISNDIITGTLHTEESAFVLHSSNSIAPIKFMVHEEYQELPGSSIDRESVNVVEAMKRLDFWLLFAAMSCGMGSGLATINNMNQIGQSFGFNIVQINTLVSLWSIWNFLGRFGAGYISDVLLHQKEWPRPIMIAITLAIMAGGHLTIATGLSGSLYIGTVVVGICYGAQWSMMPTVTSEVFGVTHMGTIFNTIAIACPVGTYILSVWVVGRLYDEKAEETESCLGVHCFRVSFFILAFVSFLGFLFALSLYFRTRVFYRSVVMRRLQHSLE